MNPKHILINRTDAIGDVILTLPLAGYLKAQFPQSKISFLGRSYTQSVITLSSHVDAFYNWDDYARLSAKEQVEQFKALQADVILHVFPRKEISQLAKKAGIPMRIGTSHRMYNRFTCNKKVNFSRNKSDLHEAQLNFKLLAPLGLNEIPELKALTAYYGYPDAPLPLNQGTEYIQSKQRKVILHPKSQGSAREWGLENFARLIDLLKAQNIQVFISGTQADGEAMRDFLEEKKQDITDLTGKLSLNEFIAFISHCDALVAASTGPLHIASALGIQAIGLYAPMRPIHPGRWQPVGQKAQALYLDKTCNDCRKTLQCACIQSIQPEQIVQLIG